MVRQNISGSVGEQGMDTLLAGASSQSPTVSNICRYCGWSPSDYDDFYLIISFDCIPCHLCIEPSEGFPSVARC